MFVRRPFTHIEADFCEDGVDRQGLEARSLGEIHTSDPVQMSAEIKRRLVSLRLAMGSGRWG